LHALDGLKVHVLHAEYPDPKHIPTFLGLSGIRAL
jgi:hypothetical protein